MSNPKKTMTMERREERVGKEVSVGTKRNKVGMGGAPKVVSIVMVPTVYWNVPLSVILQSKTEKR